MSKTRSGDRRPCSGTNRRGLPCGNTVAPRKTECGICLGATSTTDTSHRTHIAASAVADALPDLAAAKAKGRSGRHRKPAEAAYVAVCGAVPDQFSELRGDPESIGMCAAKAEGSELLRHKKIAEAAIETCDDYGWKPDATVHLKIHAAIAAVRGDDSEAALQLYAETREQALAIGRNAAQAADQRSRVLAAETAVDNVAGFVLTSSEMRRLAEECARGTTRTSR